MSGALPQRKPLRLSGYDYSSTGAYFVTFGTHEKQRFLGHIPSVGAIHESPAVRLTAAGEAVERCILKLPERFPFLTLDAHVVMPNHVHLLLTFTQPEERAIRESPLRRSLLSKAMGYLKMNAGQEIRLLLPLEQVWQRGYYDHLVRDENDYLRIWTYIETNPAKWREDVYYAI